MLLSPVYKQGKLFQSSNELISPVSHKVSVKAEFQSRRSYPRSWSCDLSAGKLEKLLPTTGLYPGPRMCQASPLPQNYIPGPRRVVNLNSSLFYSKACFLCKLCLSL